MLNEFKPIGGERKEGSFIGLDVRELLYVGELWLELCAEEDLELEILDWSIIFVSRLSMRLFNCLTTFEELELELEGWRGAKKRRNNNMRDKENRF